MLNVHVYVRHRKTCPHKSQRFWKKCSCPKWITWHRDGKEYRQSSDSEDWNVAADMARKIESQYRSAGVPHLPPQQTLKMAVNLFLLDREAQHLADSTISKLRTVFEKQMLTWFDDNGVRLLTDVTLPHLQAWRSTWKDGPLAAKKKQERLRGFFYFCVRNKWLPDNPALGLSRIKAGTHTADYFTPEEFRAILTSAEKFGKTEEQRVRLRAMVLLLRWSGLAIRDAVTLERVNLLDDDRLILRRAKTGVAVAVPLQPQVAMMLRRMVPNQNQRYFFWTGNGLKKSAVSDWQRALRRLFAIADLRHADGAKKRCHPHMFRHTFSIQMLLAGVPIEDVARLLGHSSVRTTEKYYASWVKARADRLEESVKSAWTV
jgi:integrase/recombinase XerD